MPLAASPRRLIVALALLAGSVLALAAREVAALDGAVRPFARIAVPACEGPAALPRGPAGDAA